MRERGKGEIKIILKRDIYLERSFRQPAAVASGIKLSEFK